MIHRVSSPEVSLVAVEPVERGSHLPLDPRSPSGSNWSIPVSYHDYLKGGREYIVKARVEDVAGNDKW